MYKFEIDYFGKTLSLETGKMAKQANGSVVVRYGNTIVLVTATAAKSNTNALGYFPLTCAYQFRAYSMGKIPGGFFKREAKPSDSETITSRMIDRPIRPLFPKAYQAETQVIANVLSYDKESPPEVAAILGASAALNISNIPFTTKIAAAVIGFDGQNFTLNQSEEQLKTGQLNLVLVASKDSVTMVESEAKELSEQQMLDALIFGKEKILPLIELQEKLVEAVKPKKLEVSETKLDVSLAEKIKDLLLEPVQKAAAISTKKERELAFEEINELVITKYPEEFEAQKNLILNLVEDIKAETLRSNILNNDLRVDGRNSKQIRPISSESGLLPSSHGSALFTRGETQALVVATLGARDDEQFIDGPPEGHYKKFYLQYNFPSFSVGEVGRLGPPGRREIGHGRLAERSLAQVIPVHKNYPFTIRVVSEVLESNGSSSMASICGGSLALADCGVPITRPVAGIAMGLVYSAEKSVILSDILGDEDHLGDMDFKVAGTSEGITGLQMDIKIEGLSNELFNRALLQAKEGRLHILKEMENVVRHPKEESKNIPQFLKTKIPTSKIRLVIGAGGQVIKGIIAETGAKIDIGDDGSVSIFSSNAQKANQALHMVQKIAGTVQIGQNSDGVIKKK